MVSHVAMLGAILKVSGRCARLLGEVTSYRAKAPSMGGTGSLSMTSGHTMLPCSSNCRCSKPSSIRRMAYNLPSRDIFRRVKAAGGNSRRSKAFSTNVDFPMPAAPRTTMLISWNGCRLAEVGLHGAPDWDVDHGISWFDSWRAWFNDGLGKLSLRSSRGLFMIRPTSDASPSGAVA